MKEQYPAKFYQRYDHYLKMNLADVPLFDLINTYTKSKKGVFLDVGCGVGYLLNWLCQNSNSQGVGVDISEAALSLARKLYPNLRLVKAGVFDLPFGKESFDVVLAINLIEHIKNHHQALGEMRRVLKKNGLFILSTPDKNSLYKKIWIHEPTHVHEFSKKEIIQLVSKYFKVTEVKFTNSVGRFNRLINLCFAKFLPCDILIKGEKL